MVHNKHLGLNKPECVLPISVKQNAMWSDFFSVTAPVMCSIN